MITASACGADGTSSQPLGVDARAQQCESRWAALYGQHANDVALLEADWRRAADACAGTGTYEYHLAAILRLRGDLAGAIAVLEPVGGAATLDRERQALLLGIKFDQALLAEPPDSQAAATASAALEQVLDRQPTDYVGLNELAAQKGQLGDHAGAARLAERVLAANPDNWVAKRTLVVAYTELGRYADAKRHIRPAVEQRESLLADYEFMLASAFCYLETGDVLTAEQVLLALQTHSPGVEKDTGFQNIAARVLRAKSTGRE